MATFGELVIKAKGSLSIVTAVNVAEMVKHNVAGLETLSIAIGTDEFVAEGATRRVSFIEIGLAKKKPAPLSADAPAPVVTKKRTARKKTATKKRTVRKKAGTPSLVSGAKARCLAPSAP